MLASMLVNRVCDDFVAPAFQRVKAETRIPTHFTGRHARAILVATAATGRSLRAWARMRWHLFGHARGCADNECFRPHGAGCNFTAGRIRS